ncbi:MAG: M15 family metallopeptidase [Treponema sp.]|jgi:D-alanyl-D-alanine carboxypeptidase|nr:M15 family metallopeptidase [Treponema sp.]
MICVRAAGYRLMLVAGILLAAVSCSRPAGEKSAGEEPEADLAEAIARFSGEETELIFDEFLARVLETAEVPQDISRRIITATAESPAFILDLLTCLEGDPFLRRLVDKQHGLPDGYEPDDLVELEGGFYQVSRQGLLLRAAAAEALETMAAAARAEGITLTASSAYRSYDYQAQVYARNVRESGQETANRESSRPGYSQHQTGLAVDFGSITDAFAETPAGRWILTNGSRFGWSLSFPDGYEAVTGYRWESWHYRYVGPELAAFIDAWFSGIQQYALRFIHEWEAANGEQS